MRRWLFKSVGSAGQIVAFAALCLSPGAEAQSVDSDKLGTGKNDSIDCTEVELDHEPDPSLTPEENLERMDAAFYRSLARFDACQNASQSSASASASGSGGGNGGAASGGGGSTGSGELSGAASTGVKGSEDLAMGQESQASSEMSGTEPIEQIEQASAESQFSDRDTASTLVSADDDRTVLLNGKIPEDIPPADNDSVLEAQIRQAAMTETDPEVKARLWDEYRRYKGVPPASKGSGQNK